jgi:ribosomal protein S18 acetylase RimI-like enzyme
MRDDELADHIARSRASYAADIERNGGMTAREAEEKAARDFESLFPDGRPIEGQYLLVVEEARSGAALGALHYAERPLGSKRAWLYEIWIDEASRGRGFGRQAMLLLEEEVRRRGFTRIELNVFGGNERARRLYRSLGYREIAVEMGKHLDES